MLFRVAALRHARLLPLRPGAELAVLRAHPCSGFCAVAPLPVLLFWLGCPVHCPNLFMLQAPCVTKRGAETLENGTHHCIAFFRCEQAVRSRKKTYAVCATCNAYTSLHIGCKGHRVTRHTHCPVGKLATTVHLQQARQKLAGVGTRSRMRGLPQACSWVKEITFEAPRERWRVPRRQNDFD